MTSAMRLGNLAESYDDSERGSPTAKESDAELCWQKALQLLAKQDYTEFRLKHKLAERFTIAAVQATLARAAEYGYINDAAYAERFISSRKEEKSRQEIRAALRERGLKVGGEVLDELYPQEDELRTAAAWLRKRHHNAEVREASEVYHLKRRLYQSLMRRGFGYQTIERALAEFLDDIDVYDESSL